MVTRTQATIPPRKLRQSSTKTKVVSSTPMGGALTPKTVRPTPKELLVIPHVDVPRLKKTAATALQAPTAASGLKATKPKKAKMVRDSFTIPKTEYTVLGELKQRAMALSHPAKKGELIRAGIKALAAMSDAGFLSAMAAVPAIKTGRPAKAFIA